MSFELSYKDLRRFTELDVKRLALGCKDIADVSSPSGLIGQKRAEAALRLGLAVKRRDYNIYITGSTGTGRTTFAERFAREQAKNEPTPCDLCYVYNFSDPKSPLLLRLNHGEGNIFKSDMNELADNIEDKLKKAFSSKSHEDSKNAANKNYQDKREGLIKIITEEASKRDFGVKLTNSGLFFMPVVNGEPLTEEQFDSLSDSEKKELTKLSDEIQTEAANIMFDLKQCDDEAKKEIEEIEYRTALFTVGGLFSGIIQKYGHDLDIVKYLRAVKEDILENYAAIAGSENEEENPVQNILPWAIHKNTDNPKSKYSVNLFVDNSKTESAPVIVSVNPSFANFAGEIEFDSEYGNLSTDFMKIRAGLIHKANGGYLILQEEDVLSSAAIWECVKKLIKTGEALIEPLREFTTGITIASIKPKAIALNVKIIIVGSHFYYDLLSAYDVDFRKLFKVNAVFDYEIEYNDINLRSIIGFIKDFCAKESLPEFDMPAVAAVSGHFVRLAENQKKLSAHFNLIQDLIIESAHYAGLEGSKNVLAAHVKKALSEAEYRSGLYEEKLNEMLSDNVIMIDTISEIVGQINGLSVIVTENRSFGKPSKITATTYVGKSGVINIEKEAEMSGSIHDKGIEVISGYLGQMYAQDFPLSLSCRVCFEQNYGGIDGDSASSTELYAILSSLSGLPLTQQIAVTGSVNQRGEIQPIGGVTAKIEGFFDLCSRRGLTGTQGVIIPVQNVRDLCLKDEVVEAVKSGKFHIYAISSIDEGLKLLTGKNAGVKNERGSYPPSSVHGLAVKKLKSFHKKSISD